MKLPKIARAIGRLLSRRNVDMVEAAARMAGRNREADAIDTAQDVVDVVKGKGR
jgi:hypothetical protein